MKFYAVKKGIKPGIYTSWKECEQNVKGFKGAVFKKFENKEDAEKFLTGDDVKESHMTKEDIKDSFEAIIYVDGSYRTADKSFSYGYILITKDKEYEGSNRYFNSKYAQFRNVAGEIYGTIYAIKKAIELNLKIIYIHHDYSGIRHWALKEWSANNELTKNYSDYFDSIKEKIEIEFIKIKSHTGVEYNEKVDKIAKNA